MTKMARAMQFGLIMLAVIGAMFLEQSLTAWFSLGAQTRWAIGAVLAALATMAFIRRRPADI